MNETLIALENRGQDGARLFSPSAGRNKSVIAEALHELLPDGASVLEVGSGTGEHGAEVGARRGDVTWRYSDPDATSRASQAAWAMPSWPPPLSLDLRHRGWFADLPRYDAIYSANMIHIAPIEALHGLIAGAKTLTDRVILYGPFLFGEDSASSNLDFDADLRRRNPLWGVREFELVKHIFADAGFSVAECRPMPRNNILVVFSRR